MGTYIRYIAISLLLVTAACSKKEPEVRGKMEYGNDKITLPEELAEYGNYSKYQDRLLRAKYWEEHDRTREKFQRDRRIADAMKDGTLMEEYTIQKKKGGGDK